MISRHSSGQWDNISSSSSYYSAKTSFSDHAPSTVGGESDSNHSGHSTYRQNNDPGPSRAPSSRASLADSVHSNQSSSKTHSSNFSKVADISNGSSTSSGRKSSTKSSNLSLPDYNVSVPPSVTTPASSNGSHVSGKSTDERFRYVVNDGATHVAGGYKIHANRYGQQHIYDLYKYSYPAIKSPERTSGRSAWSKMPKLLRPTYRESSIFSGLSMNNVPVTPSTTTDASSDGSQASGKSKNEHIHYAVNDGTTHVAGRYSIHTNRYNQQNTYDLCKYSYPVIKSPPRKSAWFKMTKGTKSAWNKATKLFKPHRRTSGLDTIYE